jgi:membrane-bound lytic murein transglycosylase MltF
MERICVRLISVFLLAALGCGGADRGGDPPAPDAEVEPADATAPILSSFDDLPLEFQRLMEPWTGDLDGMAQRRAIRVLTVNNPMFYAMDGVEQRGIIYESAMLFEKFINEHLRTGRLKVRVVIVPVLRDELIPAMVDGRGDIAAANLTITPERLEVVDFSDPLLGDVDEIVVTGSSSPPLDDLDSLAGRELHLRPSSSYWSSVERLNASLAERGLSPVKLTVAPPYLEDHDLIEMVHAGVLPLTVVDSHKARFWERVFDDISVREDLALAENGQIGWAIRKGSPELRELVNAFVRKHRRGTLIGNVLHNRYLENTAWIENHLDGPGRRRFEETAPLFRTYGERYDLDWVLLAAQGYQESRLDQRRKSRRGAVGVMQLLPSTAKSVDVTEIHELEPNIHAGAKYMRHIADHYLGDEGLDAEQQHLLTLAAYNAGPTRMRRLRREAAAKGLDPDVWFDNVEVVVARRVGSETVRYVENIWKYHVAYTLLAERGAPAAPRSFSAPPEK